jgi:hypothetical protein
MIDFAWREELSESFGKVKRPVAEIFAMDKNGQWHALTMYVDSGADAIVLNRSMGELYGHRIEEGRRIRMKAAAISSKLTADPLPSKLSTHIPGQPLITANAANNPAGAGSYLSFVHLPPCRATAFVPGTC